MQTRHLGPHSFERRFILIALGVVLCGSSFGLAQLAGGEAVEKLRQTLSGPVDDPAKRDWDLKDRIAALTGIGDLRRALTLREWRDDDPDQKIAVIDRANRLIVVRRFEQAVRDMLQHGNEANRMDVLSMLAEMGTTAHGIDTRRGIVRDFAADLVDLIKRGEPSCCAAALRTLGQIDPEPEIALSGFSGSLYSPDVNQRLAAADGLLGWMRTTAELAMLDSRPDGVEVSRADFVTVAWGILSLAARGLRAQEPEIRRRSAEAIGYAATALHNWVLAARGSATTISAQHRTEEEAELLPLLVALQDQRSALTHCLMDPDAEVRSRADRALEDMTVPQEMSSQEAVAPAQTSEKLECKPVPASGGLASRERQRPEESTPGERTPVTDAPGPRPRTDGFASEKPAPELVQTSAIVLTAAATNEEQALSQTVEALAEQLTDANVLTRRTALETLESLGQEAAPATAQLVLALGDPDKFVRWAAVRMLGRMRPVGEELIVPAFAQLLADPDLDVRLAAATALERWGPTAHAAGSDLRRTLRSTDAELRLAALRALAAIGGPEAKAALSEITIALTDSDARVRTVAAWVLGGFGPAARDAVPALYWALKDDSPEVQKTASDALLNILRSAQE